MEKPHFQQPPSSPFRWVDAVGPALAGLVVLIFYGWIPAFGPGHEQSPLVWLQSTWNSQNDFEHGFLVPLIMVGLLVWQGKKLRQSVQPGSWLGAAVAMIGVGFFVLSWRTGQARLAIGGLPMILWGSAWFLYGWRVAVLTFFPLFLLWLAIPVPQFQQATTKLQILSTHLASTGCRWLGIETEVRGTQIASLTQKWDPLEIDDGCSGIRSLMALILISSVWAYISKMPLWKKAILCLSAFPLAIIGNTLRLTSIFMIAEYGDPHFAIHTWHDWAGLVIFYPISLILLLGLHALLEGGKPLYRWFRPKSRRVVRKQVQMTES
ncbi:exosortase [Haloferula luteola]|uniref:Exosortase n=1 Tax=Haloferula luteola TaxID=595692 RepID=A0A840UXD1_9BACT|nr:exosortase/archaeosortase family protein [Haloferula luteola]MBB5350817.1 exosortase [Haloferula luteola]